MMHNGVHQQVFKPIKKPLVVPRMKVLADFHHVKEAEYGSFSFGGQKRTVKSVCLPYKNPLESYEEYGIAGFYSHISHAKQICNFKFVLMYTCEPI
jgi:hypothetical protein